MRKLILSVMMAALMAAPVWAQKDTREVVKQLSLDWLALVDAQNYNESYEQTASYFKDQLTAEQWEGSLKRVRQTLGSVESRKFLSATYMTELPNAPKGEYIVVLYESKLKDGRRAVETVTPMRDKDRQWRVSGYYIQPLPESAQGGS